MQAGFEKDQPFDLLHHGPERTHRLLPDLQFSPKRAVPGHAGLLLDLVAQLFSQAVDLRLQALFVSVHRVDVKRLDPEAELSVDILQALHRRGDDVLPTGILCCPVLNRLIVFRQEIGLGSVVFILDAVQFRHQLVQFLPGDGIAPQKAGPHGENRPFRPSLEGGERRQCGRVHDPFAPQRGKFLGWAFAAVGQFQILLTQLLSAGPEGHRQDDDGDIVEDVHGVSFHGCGGTRTPKGCRSSPGWVVSEPLLGVLVGQPRRGHGIRDVGLVLIG